MKTLRQMVMIATGFLGASCSAVYGQAPDAPKSPSTLSPEQMVEEALRRYDVGEFQDAWNYVQRVKAQKPDLEKLKLITGLLYIEQRSPTGSRRGPEAMPLLNDYNNSSEGKNDYRGHAALGRLYKESKMYHESVRPLEKAKLLAPTEHEGKPLKALITMDLAQAYFGMDKKKQAMAAAREAETLAPNDANIQLDLGRIALSSKDYDSAVRASDRALGLLGAKNRTDPYKMQDLKDMEESVELKIKVFLTKLDEDTKDARTCSDLAAALREKSDIEKRIFLVRARDFGLKGVANDPKMYKLQVFTARLEADLGALQDAIDRLNDTVNNDPDNQEAIKLRAELQARMSAPRP